MSRVGRVVKLRISPTDCMSCVDVAESIGLCPPGTSFGTAVSVALRALLESARQSGAIPTRDGFEYHTRMARFTDVPIQDRVRKLQINQVLTPMDSEVTYPTLSAPATPVVHTPQRARLEARASELRFQRSQDPENFSPEQQAELEAIADQLAGL